MTNPEPIWKNIQRDRCPLDNRPLIKQKRGYECELAVAPDPHTCRFFITHDKREILLAKMIRKPLRAEST